MSAGFPGTLWRQINAQPRKVFLQNTQHSYSYGLLARAIRCWCRVFDEHSVEPRDRVVIVCTDELLASSAFLAALLDGKVPVMLNPESPIERLFSICRVTEPALLVVEDPNARLKLLARGYKGVPPISIEDSGKRNLFSRFRSRASDTLPGREPQPGKDSDDLAYILFTSGTTGEPSGVEITHGALQAHMATLTRLFEYSSNSCIANPTPLSHTDGLTQGLLLTASNGARLLRPGRFALDDLESWLDQFCRCGATHLITNPTVLALIHQLAEHDDYFSFDGFQAILSSASTLRGELWHSFETRFNCRIFNLYGMTETVANATYAGDHPEMGGKGTIGVPIDGEARIVDPSDGVTPTTGSGELQLRGRHICRGYWRNPQRTGKSFVEGGWFRTGDLARRDAEGNLVFVGRLKTVINTGGLSVAPEEVDEALLRRSGVHESVTVGLPHAEFEEIAVSAVVMDEDITTEELLAHARQSLEPLKVPRQIVPVTSIPRGGAGKPDLPLLKEQLQALISGGAALTEPSAAQRVSMRAVIDLAARVFNIDAAQLSADSTPQTLKAWDSFNHLTLVLEAETAFELTIPTSAIAAIGSLRELHETICRE